MAEAFLVVGVFANIIQVVEYGSKVLVRLDQFQSAVGDIPEAFRHVKAVLPVLLDTLEQTKVAIETGHAKFETKNALVSAIDGCRTQIEALNTVVEKILPLPGDSWAVKSRKAISSLRQDAKVGKIRTNLQGYVQTLTYYHAASSAVLRPHTDLPLLAGPTPSSTVPFRRDQDFVDCDVLSEVHRRCSQPASRAALVGLGGVGKSQLAIEFSYQLRERSPETWVFWVHAATAARFEEGYRNIAEKANVPGWDKPKVDILRLVKNWLCDEVNGRWLMIVDNADDLEVTRSYSDFLPQSPNGSILITSRSDDVAFRMTGRHSDVIKVKPMDQEHAILLLRRKLPEDVDATHADELVRILDYMPLAVSQAGAYIGQRAPRITVSKYLHDLRGNDKDRANLLMKDVGDTRRDGKASNSIIATWQISFEHIRKEKPPAARLLSLMSLFDRQGIPESLLHQRYQENVDKEVDFDDDIATLASYSLITMNEGGNGFEMHRLVQFSTKTWLELNGQLEEWKERYITILHKTFPFAYYKNWATCQELFSHAEMVLGYWPKNEVYIRPWASIVSNAACYAKKKGNYATAQEMDQQALDARAKALGKDHFDTLTSMNSLATVLSYLGKYKEAEEIHRQVLHSRGVTLGNEHPSTLVSMSNLAIILSYQGKWKEAEAIGLQVVEARKRVLGEKNPDTLTAMASLSASIWNQGRWEEAEELGLQVMETRRKVLGEEHPDTLSSMLSVAAPAHLKRGRYKEAEQVCFKVMETRKRILGEEHPGTLVAMADLASSLINQRRWKECEEIVLQVMETRKKVLGEEHPDTLRSMSQLAWVSKRQGRDTKALDIMSKCVTLSRIILGNDHPKTISRTRALNSWTDD